MPRDNPVSQPRSVNVAVSDIAKVQRQVVGRNVGGIQSSRAGLESLGQAFSQFFGGLARTTSEMAEVEIKQQKADIAKRKEQSEKEAEAYDKIRAREAAVVGAVSPATTAAGRVEYAQTESEERISDYRSAENEAERVAKAQAEAQGKADALAGKDIPAEMRGNVSYMSSYSTVLGEQAGLEAAVKWEQHLTTLGADVQNIDEELAKFKNTEFGNGVSGPFGDFFNGKALEVFSSRAQQANSTWRTNRAKTLYNQGITKLGDVVSAYVSRGEMTVGRFQDAMRQSIALHKDEPQKARPEVVGALIEGATTPAALANLDTLLNTPGTGNGDQSFAQSFPGEFAELQDKVVTKWKNTVTIRAAAEYSKFDDMLRHPAEADTPEILAAAGQQLEETFQQHGGLTEYERRSAKLIERQQKFVENVADANRYINVLNGAPGAGDKKLINKAQAQVFRQNGITDILADRQTAETVAGASLAGGGLATEFEQQVSYALNDFTNPARQANAFYMVRAIEQGNGELPTMSEESKITYSLAADEAAVNGGDPSALFARMAADPAGRKAAQKPLDWREVYAMPDGKAAEAQSKARQDVIGALAGKLGLEPEAVVMGQGVEDAFLTSYGRAVSRARLFNADDPLKSAQKYVTDYADLKYIAVPSGDGMFRVEPNRLPTKDSAGVPIVAPGVSRNPVSGATENTLDTYAEDLERLQGRMPETALGANDVSLDRPDGNGVFRVTAGGEQIVFLPGAKVDGIQGVTDVKLPKDPTLAAQMLNSYLPQGFTAVPAVTGQGTVLYVGYRFHYQQTQSLADKAKAYKPRVQPGPMLDYGTLDNR